uniref:Uncharacterized protein n=1 Tax=Euplotes crassus TaxID=5936 RepID=A0A7S3KBP4_EUPCR|mmetsp:Transcript_16074/g.15798  ORF Transcript_16074/g.15798 Transcript_16074/m.15798 type:complete len:106 (+) Transcript_16074:181-498(+)
MEPHKGYPKNPFTRGRVKVLLKDDDGQMQHDTIMTKKALLLKLCQLFPKLKTRQENPDGVDAALEEEKALEAAANAEPAPQTRAEKKEQKKAEKKKNKKKGKKKW